MSVHESFSQAELLASLPEEERRQLFAGLTEAQSNELLYDWRFWARPKQLAPAGDWATWLLRAGRGFGKTRTGSGWVHERAMAEPGRWIALGARTPADARDYMIEGPSGLLRTTAPDARPLYEPSKRRVTWPNGSWATIYSDDEPDQVRGFSGDTAWLDEFAKFKNARTFWDNLQFGMREASRDRPRRLITTTPRPLAILKEIEALPSTITVTGTSHENRANLDQSWFADTIIPYEGTRLGRQEIGAEYIDDAPGALWQRSMFEVEGFRVSNCPHMRRVVVAVDPPTSSSGESALAGIVVCGLGFDGRCYVIEDCSGRMSPGEWGARAVRAFDNWFADRIVAEGNQGGDMVRYTIQTVRGNAPVSIVHASRSKQARAEPVAALYEQRKVSHVGAFPELEDQMCTWEPLSGQPSPDRIDSLVYGLTELAIGGGPLVFTVPESEFVIEPLSTRASWRSN
jgi:phage terminase large subunit-like protein